MLLVYTMLPLFGWARGVVLLSLFSFYRFSRFCPACGRCWLLPGGFTKHFGQLYMNYKFHHPFPALHLLSLNMALLKTLTHPSQIPIGNPNFELLPSHFTSFNRFHRKPRIILSRLRICPAAGNTRTYRLITACISPSQEIIVKESEIASENGHSMASVLSTEEEEEQKEVVEMKGEEFVANESLWNQIIEIMKFSGPATALWVCGPLMSLIDTAVIGQGSSLELAALGNLYCICCDCSIF